MKKYLNQDELIDRLSDYAGENYYNRNSRFGGEVDEFDYFFKQLARTGERGKRSDTLRPLTIIQPK